MVGWVEVAFWVGHQAEYSPGRIADTGDIPLGSIGVDWEFERFIAGLAIGIAVANGDLFASHHLLGGLVVAHEQSALGMRHRQIDLIDASQEHAVVGFRF